MFLKKIIQRLLLQNKISSEEVDEKQNNQMKQKQIIFIDFETIKNIQKIKKKLKKVLAIYKKPCYNQFRW